VLVYAVVSEMLSPSTQLGEVVETFVRREDAERFIKEVRGDDPELAEPLRIEERELERYLTEGPVDLRAFAPRADGAFGIAEADKPARFSQCVTGQVLSRIEPFKVWVELQRRGR